MSLRTLVSEIGYRRILTAVVSAACVLASLVIAPLALAQIDPEAAYKMIEILPTMDIRMPDVDKDDKDAFREALKAKGEATKQRNNYRGIVLAILAGTDTEPFANRETIFNGYFEKVIFAEMTQTDRESLLAIPKLRERFFLDYFDRSAKTAPLDVRDRLLKMTRAKMLEIARDTYHPAVRYNAMLVLGKLNSKEASTIGEGEDKAPPVPWFEVLGDMYKEFISPTQIEEVRMAAILGMLRHAEMDGQRPADQRIRPEPRIAIINAMVELIRMADPPANRTPQGHQWMQRRAVEVLGAFRDPGPGNNALIEFERILADDTLSLPYRCTTAVAYGRLIFQPADTAAPSERVLRLAALASSACKQEIARLDAEVMAINKRNGSPATAEGEELSPETRMKILSELDPYKVTASRRMLKYCIQSVQDGVGKNDQSGYRRYSQADPHKAFVASVEGALENLMKATDKKKEQSQLTADLLVREIDNQLRELDRIILAASPKKPADAPAEVPPVEGVKPPDAPAAPVVPPPAAP